MNEYSIHWPITPVIHLFYLELNLVFLCKQINSWEGLDAKKNVIVHLEKKGREGTEVRKDPLDLQGNKDHQEVLELTDGQD